MTTNALCHNCGAVASWKPLFEARHNTVGCGECGGWAFRGALEVTAGELYDEHYFNGGEYFAYDAARAVHVLNFRRKLRMLRRLGLPSPLRVVELGSATGEFLALVKDEGAQTLGIEASQYCRDLAATRGLRLLAPDAPQLDEELRRFQPNMIVGWDVWEHLSQPAAIVDAILAKAAPDVVLAFTTVDASSMIARLRGAKWRQFHPPTHLNFPTRESFVRYLGARGFSIMHHRSFGYYRPFGEYLRAILPAALGRGLTPKTPVARWPVYLNLFDTQMVVARRRNFTEPQ